jgi:hypothetical protein
MSNPKDMSGEEEVKREVPGIQKIALPQSAIPAARRGFCEHGRKKSRCRDCGGGSFCEHNVQRYNCHKCIQARCIASLVESLRATASSSSGEQSDQAKIMLLELQVKALTEQRDNLLQILEQNQAFALAQIGFKCMSCAQRQVPFMAQPFLAPPFGAQAFSGTQPFPGAQTFPGTQPFPGSQSFPNTSSFPGTQTFPGSQTFPNASSFSGSQPFPGGQPFPGIAGSFL